MQERNYCSNKLVFPRRVFIKKIELIMETNCLCRCEDWEIGILLFSFSLFSVFTVRLQILNLLVGWIKYKVYDITPLSHIAKVHIYRVTVYTIPNYSIYIIIVLIQNVCFNICFRSLPECIIRPRYFAQVMYNLQVTLL